MRIHYPTAKVTWSIWMIIALPWTYLASASCNTAQWKPLTGQTIGLVLEALDVTTQDLEALNPSISVDRLKDDWSYNVPFNEILVFGSWSTDCPRLLHIPRHPIVSILTPPIRQCETGVSYILGFKSLMTTGPHVIPGTGVIVQPASTTNKVRETSIVATSCIILNSMPQSAVLTNDASDTFGMVTSETYDIVPIETLMTLIRISSARTTFEKEVKQTAVTSDNGVKLPTAPQSQKSTTESISTTKLEVESMMGELYTQLEHWQTLLHATTAVDLTSHAIADTADVSTTLLSTPRTVTTLAAKLEDTNGLVLITSTVTIVEKQTVT